MTISKISNLLDFPSVDVVEASAGSGKTHALAKRYIQLIMDPNLGYEGSPLRSILAITFTNKASLQMKERILEFLKSVALDAFRSPQDKDEIMGSIAINEKQARLIAGRLMDEIIKSYNFFQIETIDSFIKTILSGCSLRLGISSNFDIRYDHLRYLQYCLDEIVDKVHKDKKICEIFENFLEYYLFIENKDSWFIKQDILRLVESLYKLSVTYGAPFKRIDIDKKDIWRARKEILNLSKKIYADMPKAADGIFVNSLRSFVQRDRDDFDIDKLSTYFRREKFPVKRGHEVPDGIAKSWDNLRKSIDELCVYESCAIFKPYLDILEPVMEEFKRQSHSDGVIFLQELNMYAQSLNEGADMQVGELYYRIATRLRHYLIDEFQDTNRLQWKNIQPMISEALSSGGSLFYVGDKKQAMYRFRGGDVSLFDDVSLFYNDLKPRKTALCKNYRSQKQIVEFNNRVFSRQNIARFMKDLEGLEKMEFSDSDIEAVLNVFEDSRQGYKDENKYGYVSVEALNEEDSDDKKAIMRGRLKELINDLRKRFALSDIAILAKRNEDVELFSSWLIEEDIPVESDKTVDVHQHPLVKELISFLKFLNSPIDNLSFASFISGEIFGRSSVLDYSEIEKFLFELGLRCKQEEGVYFYIEFRKKFHKVWDELLEEFFKNVGLVPLYELIISIFTKFCVLENFARYQGFFMKFLELIKAKEDEYCGLSGFVELLEEMDQRDLFVNVTGADSVKIMTIHSAKGLEFGAVIVPFLAIDVTIGAGVAERKKPYVIRQSDEGLSLIQLKQRYAIFSKELGAEYKSEYINTLIDELDAIYVALTRPIDELYIFVPKRTSNKKNLARQLIPFEKYESGSKIAHSPKPIAFATKKADRQNPIIKLPVCAYSDWINVLKNEFIGYKSLLNRDNIVRGNIIHFILSRVGNLYTQKLEVVLKAAAELAHFEFPYVDNLDEYLSIARLLLKDERFKEFFYIKDGELFQEKEVVDSNGNLKRLDRLIVTKNEAVIVDYKSSKDEELSQGQQIIEYIKIIRSIYPRLKVKAFLIYLDRMEMEEIKADANG